MTNLNPNLDQMTATQAILELANRIERNGGFAWEAVADLFDGLEYAVIEALESILAATGNPPLPPALNRGSPAFQAAVGRLNAFGLAANGVPEFDSAWVEFITLAPPWFRVEIDRIARETKALPEPDFVTADGSPAFSIDCIAEHFGITVEEAAAGVEKLRASGETDLLVEEPVFRVQ